MKKQRSGTKIAMYSRGLRRYCNKFHATLKKIMTEGNNFPDIFVLTSVQNLKSELERQLPKNVNIIQIPANGLSTVQQSLVTSLQNAEVLVTDGPFLMQLVYSLPRAKWVQNSWAGVEPIIEKLDRSKPFPSFMLTRYSDAYFGESMANYVMAHIINIERELFTYHDNQKKKKWDKSAERYFRVLSDVTVGILGAGKIGAAVGRHLKRCGSRVIAFVRKIREGPSDDYDEIVTELEVILNQSDYICNVLPSTKSTRGLLDNDLLSKCKKKPVFINVGRGDIIQTTSLVKAIEQQWIAGAVLDVFVDEPLPQDSPLWSMPKVHITPHIGSVTTVGGLAKFTAENYMRYISGEQLMNVVDWNTGY